ncbi:MAG: helix-turn-helix transcriptional regulator [Eubacteriales bacterium]|nr:helix-turn-helix transcriptional regulator [Eubacteriales bacterium]
MDLMTANRLQQLRKANGYSQDVLAEKLGISRQAVSKWERAESSPSVDNLLDLARLYGITVDEMLNTDGDRVVIKTQNNTKKDIKGKLKSLISKANDFGIYPELARSLAKFPFFLVVTVLYVVLCFVTKLWHPLWIMFLALPIYYQFALACKGGNKKVFMLLLPIPEIIVTVFLILGFAFGIWKYAWILFLILPIYYWIVLINK